MKKHTPKNGYGRGRRCGHGPWVDWAREATFDVYEFLEDDLLLPEQLPSLRNREIVTGEYRLLRAFFETALEDVLRWVGCRRESAEVADEVEEQFVDAMEWVLTENPAWPYAFASTCEYLAFDPSYVRGLFVAVVENVDAERMDALRRRLGRDTPPPASGVVAGARQPKEAKARKEAA